MVTPPQTNWHWVVETVLANPPATNVRIAKSNVPPPLQAGFRLSSGLPKGQLLDFRWAHPTGRGIHVRDFGSDFYEVHWDRVDPAVSLWGHLVQDTPGLVKFGVIGAALVGVALVFSALANSKRE